MTSTQWGDKSSSKKKTILNTIMPNQQDYTPFFFTFSSPPQNKKYKYKFHTTFQMLKRIRFEKIDSTNNPIQTTL